MQKALEIKRVEKIIGASLEAKLEIICNTDEKYEEVKALSDELAKIIIVSHVSVLKGESGEFKGDLFGTDGISFNAKKQMAKNVKDAGCTLKMLVRMINIQHFVEDVLRLLVRQANYTLKIGVQI